MVQVFKPATKKKQKKPNGVGALIQIKVDTLDHMGQGVLRGHPVTFVTGALPDETCKVRITKNQKNARFGQVEQVIEASPKRLEPVCTYFERCGGCQTQYAEPDYMLSQKQNAVAQLLAKLTPLDVQSLPWSHPIVATSSGYRRKARLALDVRNQPIKLGFRDDENQVLSIEACPILAPSLNTLLSLLPELVESLQCKKDIGHIQLFEGQNRVLESEIHISIRVTADVDTHDRALLREFESENGVIIVLELEQSQYLPLSSDKAEASYVVYAEETEKPLLLELMPGDFVQVNASVNQQMIHQAINWLELAPEDKVLDLFCGIGNFSLPIATKVGTLTGFEVSPEMVQQARNNANLNDLENVEFVCGDLTDEKVLQQLQKLKFNKVLLDPARAGAREALEQVLSLAPEKILYVSCNPATFGRDIAKVFEHNYKMDKIALLDMFPYTAHTEIMSLFSAKK